MPRQSIYEQNVRQNGGLNLNPVFTQVVAHPVSQMVTPAYGNAMRLAEALSGIEPTLQKMGERILKKQEEDNNFALQTQAMDDGAAGKESSMPDNQVYQRSYLQARTGKLVSDYSAEFSAWREANRLNPDADYNGFISELDKKYSQQRMQYTGLSGMSQPGISTANAAGLLAHNASQAKANEEKGAADATLGIKAQSSSPDYLRAHELSAAVSAESRINEKMSKLFLDNSNNPQFDMNAGFDEIIQGETQGLGDVSPRAQAHLSAASHMMKTKLMHEMAVIQKSQLQKETNDGHEQGSLALVRDATKSVADRVYAMDMYDEGTGNTLSVAQKRLNRLKAIEAFGNENAPQAMGVLNEKNKDGIRLVDTVEGANLYSKISAEHERKMAALAKKNIDAEKFDVKVHYDNMLLTDPTGLLKDAPKIRGFVNTGHLSAEEGSTLISKAVSKTMDDEKLAIQKAQIEGPQAYFYRFSNPETAAVWQKSERAAYEDTQVKLQPELLKLSNEKDPAARQAIQTKVNASVTSFIEPRLRDGMLGRGLSPMVNELFKAGPANPMDSDGNASVSLQVSKTIYDTAVAKGSPELLKLMDKETMVYFGALNEQSQRFNGDLNATVKYLNEEALKKEKNPQDYAGKSSSAAPSSHDIETALVPWANKYGIKNMPDGMAGEIQKVVAKVSKMNQHLDKDVVLAEAVKTVAGGYVQVGERAMKVPEGVTTENQKFYQQFYGILSQRYDSKDMTMSGLAFDDSRKAVDIVFIDNKTGLKGVETIKREDFDNEVDKFTFINQEKTAETLRSMQNDAKTMNDVMAMIAPGSEKFDDPTEISITSWEKRFKDKQRFDVAVKGWKEKVERLPLDERIRMLEQLNIAVDGEPNAISAWFEGRISMPLKRLVNQFAESKLFGVTSGIAKKSHFSSLFHLSDLAEQTKKEYLFKKNTIESTEKVASGKPLDTAGYGSIEESVASDKKRSTISSRKDASENATHLQGTLMNAPQHSRQLAFTGSIEGFKGIPYKDAGGVAIGYGYNVTNNAHRAVKDLKAIGRSDADIAKIMAGDTTVTPLTREEGQRLFNVQTAAINDELVGRIGVKAFNALDAQQKTVLQDVVYNMGVPNAMKTRAVNSLVQGDTEGFLRNYAEMAKNQKGQEHVNNFRNRLGAYASMLKAPDVGAGLTRHLNALKQ